MDIGAVSNFCHYGWPCQKNIGVRKLLAFLLRCFLGLISPGLTVRSGIQRTVLSALKLPCTATPLRKELISKSPSPSHGVCLLWSRRPDGGREAQGPEDWGPSPGLSPACPCHEQAPSPQSLGLPLSGGGPTVQPRRVLWAAGILGCAYTQCSTPSGHYPAYLSFPTRKRARRSLSPCNAVATWSSPASFFFLCH